MRFRFCRRRILLTVVVIIGLLFFMLSIILIPRRSPQLFVTEPDVVKWMQQNNTNSNHHRRIPRIIHQTWKNANVPENWNITVQTVQQLNANEFEYRLWTDEDMHEFVRQKEPDLYQNTFLTYSLDIQRIDAFRYVLLYYLGGIYIDMDNGCRQSLNPLLDLLEIFDPQSVHLAAFSHTQPIGISNGFMISTKGHPLFAQLVSRLSLFNHNYLVDYLTVMLSAGPLYLSLNEHLFDTSSRTASVRIIDDEVYSSIFTWHTPGNSWHGRDARLILYIYYRLRFDPFFLWELIFMIIFVIVVLCFLYMRCRRRCCR